MEMIISLTQYSRETEHGTILQKPSALSAIERTNIHIKQERIFTHTPVKQGMEHFYDNHQHFQITIKKERTSLSTAFETIHNPHAN